MTVKEYNKAVGEFSDHVYRFILSNIRDDSRACDIVQDSFEKLWNHVTELEYQVVKSWLFSTAYHLMIDVIRHEKRMTGMEAAEDTGYFDETQYNDLNTVLHKALQILPEQQRTTVLLRDYEGYSYREIGEITGMNEAQVKISIYRGRVALKNYIRKIEIVL